MYAIPATVAASALVADVGMPLCYGLRPDPWRAIAAKIALAGKTGEPIFFETGFFALNGNRKVEVTVALQQICPCPVRLFLYRNSNPRRVVLASEPATARKLIEAQIKSAGGAWLISAKQWPAAIAEPHQGPHLQVDFHSQRFSGMAVFHVRRAG